MNTHPLNWNKKAIETFETTKDDLIFVERQWTPAILDMNSLCDFNIFASL